MGLGLLTLTDEVRRVLTVRGATVRVRVRKRETEREREREASENELENESNHQS